jgi:hypothetical protein
MLRLLAALLFLSALATTAGAADARRFAVLSLIGDKLQMAQAKPLEGTPVDRIERNQLPLDDPMLDRTALQTINEELRRSQPTTPPVLLQATEPGMFDDQAKLLEPGSGGAALLGKIRDQLKGTQSTHLIVVVKDRYDGIPDLQRSFVGTKELDGIGFFVGRTASPLPGDASAVGPGFLAPFAYFRVALIDLASGRVLKQERANASTAISAETTLTGNPWEALSAQQKVRTLQDLIRRELARIMPVLLK